MEVGHYQHILLFIFRDAHLIYYALFFRNNFIMEFEVEILRLIGVPL